MLYYCGLIDRRWPKGESDMELKFGDLVKVTKGFYCDFEGVVMRESLIPSMFHIKKRYYVKANKATFNRYEIISRWFKEEDLEKI